MILRKAESIRKELGVQVSLLDNEEGALTQAIVGSVLLRQGETRPLTQLGLAFDMPEEKAEIIWRDVYAQVNSAWMPLPSPPTVDFPRVGVLLIAMGQRPTAGYGLALADEVATVRDGVLTVRVRWREPPPGRRQAQVMTSPCLLATVPDAGFTRIRVVDQNGGVRLEGAR